MSYSPTPAADFMMVENTVNQLNLTDGTKVVWSTAVKSRGGLALASSTITGLKAGQLYLLLGAMVIVDSTAQRMQFTFWDTTANAAIGRPWDVRSANNGSAVGQAQTGIALFVPLVTTAVEMQRLGGSANTIDLNANNGANSSWCRFWVIEQ